MATNQPQQQQQQSQHQQQPTQQTTHKTITGFVTKLVGDGDTYGFINDEIFFPQTNVSGGPASVGDQVFAECEFSAHLPIKWSATSLKIVKKAGCLLPVNNSAAPSPADPRHQAQQFNNNNNNNQSFRSQNVQHDKNQDHHNPNQPTPSMTNPGEIFGPASTARPLAGNFQALPNDTPANLQPFQQHLDHQHPPMGPPNFAFTSQLGSAFVQNQFVPSPFLTQQPPPSILAQQGGQPPQHLLASGQPSTGPSQIQQQSPNQQSKTNQQQKNFNNQRNNQQHNNNMNNSNNRFNNGNNLNNNNNNNQGGDMMKNDRQVNRRNNLNRFDNNNQKFLDRSRSGDRDDSNNTRQNRNDSRDRMAGRNKRDDSSTRISPSSHTSAKSTISNNSDKTKSSTGSSNKNRRHYEALNIPKTQIMRDINSQNIKQRCPSSVHIPSDLKSIIINSYFRLNLKTIPKPIHFIIEQQESNAQLNITKHDQQDATVTNKDIQSEDQQIKTIESSSQPEQPTPPSSKSDHKLNHKYGVKVILISLPDFDSLYHSIFGHKLDSFSLDGKNPYKKMDELISLLCNKGSNNGYSLIGGKFDPILDGFVEGESNEFERHGRKPDLIATCKRIVTEHTGLDLSKCRSWNLISTFMYNNKSDYFSPRASIEYSYIYMPEIWTMLTEKFDPNVLDREILDKTGIANDNETTTTTPVTATNDQISKDETNNTQDEPNSTQLEPVIDSADDNAKQLPVFNQDGQQTLECLPFNLTNLVNMELADIKSLLNEFKLEFNEEMERSQLEALLIQYADNIKTERNLIETKQPDQEDEGPQLEEGEVLPGASETNSPDLPDDDEDIISGEAGKRKAGDAESSLLHQASKKLCVNLIKDAFIIKSSKDQPFSMVTLQDATQAGKYDQFELSVASNILKESLIQHFSEYMLTCLVEDYRQRSSSSSSSSSSCGGPNTASSQETNSDSNNNTSKSKSTSGTSNPTTGSVKEFKNDRYINLAFSYFDSSHTGYVFFDDLSKLFNNTGLTISKRALTALIGDGEKFYYRMLPDLSSKLPPTYLYEFPHQFSRLPKSISMSSSSEDRHPSSSGSTLKLIEHKGVVYDVDKLIQQVRDAETLNVSLVDRFNYAIENSDKQLDEIHQLGVSQQSLTKAIKAQNEEVCDLKKERDSIKKKYDEMKRQIKLAMESMADIIKK